MTHEADKNHDLDLDALASERQPRRVALGKNKAITLGDLKELSKKDPATLSPIEKKSLEDANATMKKLVERVEPFSDAGRKISEMVKPFEMPERSLFETPRITMPAVIPPANSTEQLKQTQLLQRMVEAFEVQNADRDVDLHLATRPSYDAKKHLLIFANTPIDIPENSDQEKLCQILFRGGKPVKKPVELGDALEKMGVPLDRIKGNKKIHSAKQALNDRVEKATQIKELFLVASKKVWFNPRYM